MRPNGTPASTRALASGTASSTARNAGVSIAPGATALTRMPDRTVLVRGDAGEGLDARLARRVDAGPAWPRCGAVELTFTIAPP